MVTEFLGVHWEQLFIYFKNGAGEGVGRGGGSKKTFEFNNYNPFLPATIRPRTWFKGVVVVQGLLPPLGFLLQ